jgi:tetratricopeptide (TPR) repeat protein
MQPPPYREDREAGPQPGPERMPADRPEAGKPRDEMPPPDFRVPGLQDGAAQAQEGLRTGSVPRPPEGEPVQSSVKGRPSQRELMRAAQQAFEQGEYPAVAKAAGQAIEAEPGNPRIYAIRAVALGAMGEVPDALSEAETALRLNPKDGQVLSVHAFTLNLALRNKDAKAAAEKAIELHDDSAWTWYQLAFAQASLDDRTGSLRSLARAAEKFPEGYAAKYNAASRTRGDDELRGLLKDPMAAVLMAEARRNMARSGFGLLVIVALLAAPVMTLFLLRRRIAAWIVRMGMGASPQPPAPTPVAGLTPPESQTPFKADISATPGRIPTGYRILKQIGAGGMGAVFEAEDLSLERRVAIKRMRDEIKQHPGECERFLKEARTVAKLHHPSIVEIYAIVEFEGEILLVFEYLDGATLDTLLRTHQRFSVAQVHGVLKQVCAALGFAHERGVIHRDLKPSNIMVTRELMVKVMDFGVARLAKDALTRLSMTNTVVGTPPYMAPESETGTVRTESDLYSLGVCLYEMLTGVRPFEGTGAGMLMNKMNMRYEPASSKAPGLPPGVDAFLARALNSDPEKRPLSAAEFLTEFEKSASGT